MIHINARAPTEESFPAWLSIKFLNDSMAGLSRLLLRPALSPLKIRSKNGASMPNEAMPKTMDSIMHRK